MIEWLITFKLYDAKQQVLWRKIMIKDRKITIKELKTLVLG
ncbi:MAG: hypothetical protein OHM57_02305 [Spiroplasma phoeniceum]|nr:MAG: hypothetical protein OHM57_02305 [Spiroplasma phoeniceum]